VHEAIKNGCYGVHPRVWQQIKDAFGWKTRDLETFYSRLRPKHFYKQMSMGNKTPHDYYGDIPAIYDVYKAEDIMGEKVYTHFYFNEDRLMIDSVHELD
jgi:hypothetical protein